ncbi:hypothetical protein GOBAR_AA21385 [Gossypium barbadense]|uniref:Uncharacterized protein n=1 Tax=Gossypium barbadense TaxID=3634 RepID=A0A2P5X7F8_GOSBA|nr:hypothetical protein GOBAR_AA21385 [Gossypium barbadense]
MNEAKSLNEEIIVEDANAEDDISDGHDLSRKGIDGSRVIVVRSEEGDNKVVAVVLRGSTDSILDDLETAVDDCVNTYRKSYPSKETGLDQYAIAKFGESFELVPRTLAENAGLNPMDIISRLHEKHASGNAKVGIDLRGADSEDGVCNDFSTMKIWDPPQNLLSVLLCVVHGNIHLLCISENNTSIHPISNNPLQTSLSARPSAALGEMKPSVDSTIAMMNLPPMVQTTILTPRFSRTQNCSVNPTTSHSLVKARVINGAIHNTLRTCTNCLSLSPVNQETMSFVHDGRWRHNILFQINSFLTHQSYRQITQNSSTTTFR